MSDLRALTNDELLELCHQHGIHATVPLSQLEAEAVHRGVDLATIVRAHLVQRLQEVGVL